MANWVWRKVVTLKRRVIYWLQYLLSGKQLEHTTRYCIKQASGEIKHKFYVFLHVLLSFMKHSGSKRYNAKYFRVLEFRRLNPTNALMSPNDIFTRYEIIYWALKKSSHRVLIENSLKIFDRRSVWLIYIFMCRELIEQAVE